MTLVSVVYRLEVRSDAQHEFIAAWKEATRAFRTVGALGSRLHRTDGGDFYAYAEWPNREVWEHSQTRSPVDATTAAIMRESTFEFEMWPLAIKPDLLARTTG